MHLYFHRQFKCWSLLRQDNIVRNLKDITHLLNKCHHKVTVISCRTSTTLGLVRNFSRNFFQIYSYSHTQFMTQTTLCLYMQLRIYVPTTVCTPHVPLPWLQFESHRFANHLRGVSCMTSVVGEWIISDAIEEWKLLTKQKQRRLHKPVKYETAFYGSPANIYKASPIYHNA